MNRKIRWKISNGYTLTELLLVMAIIAVIASILTPHFDLVLQRAYQSKAKGSLGFVRTAIAIYYTDQEGKQPLGEFPEGNSHYVVNGLSLTELLVPKYLSVHPTPQLKDRLSTFNDLPGLSYDAEAIGKMSKNPPEDVFIRLGPADYTPLLNSPYAYDNHTGWIYYSNGNYAVDGNYFYEW